MNPADKPLAADDPSGAPSIAEASAGDPAGRHDGVVTFKAKDGSNVRIGSRGGSVLVECR